MPWSMDILGCVRALVVDRTPLGFPWRRLTNPVQLFLEFLTAHHFHATLLNGLVDLPGTGDVVFVLKSLTFFIRELVHFLLGEPAEPVFLPENTVNLVFIVRGFCK